MKQHISEGAGRKQMSHSKWVTWGELTQEVRKYNQAVEKPPGTMRVSTYRDIYTRPKLKNGLVFRTQRQSRPEGGATGLELWLSEGGSQGNKHSNPLPSIL